MIDLTTFPGEGQNSSFLAGGIGDKKGVDECLLRLLLILLVLSLSGSDERRAILREGEMLVRSVLFLSDFGMAEGVASDRVKMHASRSLGGGSGSGGEERVVQSEDGALTP